MTRLTVLIDGAYAGLLVNERGRLTFTYDDAYRRDPAATPLSTNLPLAAQEHTGRKVLAFIGGLLPDSDIVRARWAAEFQARNSPFDLLCHVGEDCAGGVQFVRDDRLDTVADGGIEWLTEIEIGNWIRDLRRDPAGWLNGATTGQFSLAGAQAKFALHLADGRWGRPHGAMPTTHIVKPAALHLSQHEINEHLALELARAVGLAAARSTITAFDGEQVVVVERFDRFETPFGYRRVHQEDFCQAAGCMPELKYENQGGPSIIAIARMIRRHSTQPQIDRQTFIDSVVFNWVIANTDAHAKNYSLLLASDQVRFAPLYDLASSLPYTSRLPVAATPGELDGSRLSLAMSLMGTYRLNDIRLRDWMALFYELGVEPDEQVGRAFNLSTKISEAVAALRHSLAGKVGEPMLDRFTSGVQRRANACASLLLGRSPTTGHRP